MPARIVLIRFITCLALAAMLSSLITLQPARAQAMDPNPPAETVRLIFIHHSTGENWLTDDYGNLGIALADNNYFVSDTNYGWGPDAIGDRTDIPNWPEWFRSDNTPTYMHALFNEREQHAWYTRLPDNPGGENEVIMFKSCFPNSQLEGNPDDPPTPGYEFTVGNAKWIYNDLLNYFITRPDKLFIVITAPPVQDPTYADNARAFNLWLMQDWLREANYPYSNVAVFDFYNILTHPDNHHRVVNGEIEYVTSHGDNTLYYDSDGDDHPNPEGSQKATEEFVPLLNVFYHLWQLSAPVEPPAEPETTPESAAAPPPPEHGVISGVVDNFESGPPAGTWGWEFFWDEASTAEIFCEPQAGMATSGDNALYIGYDIPAGSWGVCAIFYEQVQNWQSAAGLSLSIHASQPGLYIDLEPHGGSLEETTTYIYTLETTQEMADGWSYVELSWDQFVRVDWEADAGTPFDPSAVTGLAFGFGAPQDVAISGEIWIDDILLAGAPSLPAEEPGAPPEEPTWAPTEGPPPEAPAAEEHVGNRMCGTIPIAVLVGAGALWRRKRK